LLQNTAGESSLAYEMNTVATSRCWFVVSDIEASHRNSLTWYANKWPFMLSITFAVSRAANTEIGALSKAALCALIRGGANSTVVALKIRPEIYHLRPT